MLSARVDVAAPTLSEGLLGAERQRLGVGTVVAERYEIVRRIGSGGMGTVFEAWDLDLGRAVALKCLSPRGPVNALVMRFLREARLAAAVAHPNVVGVFDAGWLHDYEVPYLVMELLSGRTLAEELLERETLPLPQAVAVGCQLLDALAATHACHVLHRDLKPENVFLVPTDEGDRVKLLDFGISKVLDDDANLTRTGVVLGTPSFMAPEQARGDAVDPRTDLYGVGAVLYCMLSGRAPFEGVAMAELTHLLQTATPPSLAELRPELPRAIVAVVDRALQRDPRDRWADAASMRAALAGATASRTFRDPLESAMTAPYPAVRVKPARATGRTSAVQRRPSAAMPALAALTVVLAGLLGFFAALLAIQVTTAAPLP